MGLIDSKRVQRLYSRVNENRKNCSFEDVERLLLAVGFTCRNAKGSHVFFTRGALALSVPRSKPVKEVYVEQALDLIDNL